LGGHYAKKYALGLIGSAWVSISISIVINGSAFEKREGYAFAHSWCLLLSNEQSLLLYVVA
jgi:hypothetical protein